MKINTSPVFASIPIRKTVIGSGLQRYKDKWSSYGSFGIACSVQTKAFCLQNTELCEQVSSSYLVNIDFDTQNCIFYAQNSCSKGIVRCNCILNCRIYRTNICFGIQNCATNRSTIFVYAWKIHLHGVNSCTNLSAIEKIGISIRIGAINYPFSSFIFFKNCFGSCKIAVAIIFRQNIFNYFSLPKIDTMPQAVSYNFRYPNRIRRLKVRAVVQYPSELARDGITHNYVFPKISA